MEFPPLNLECECCIEVDCPLSLITDWPLGSRTQAYRTTHPRRKHQ
jgi:hypothetical protein